MEEELKNYRCKIIHLYPLVPDVAFQTDFKGKEL